MPSYMSQTEALYIHMYIARWLQSQTRTADAMNIPGGPEFPTLVRSGGHGSPVTDAGFDVIWTVDAAPALSVQTA